MDPDRLQTLDSSPGTCFFGTGQGTSNSNCVSNLDLGLPSLASRFLFLSIGRIASQTACCVPRKDTYCGSIVHSEDFESVGVFLFGDLDLDLDTSCARCLDSDLGMILR